MSEWGPEQPPTDEIIDLTQYGQELAPQPEPSLQGIDYFTENCWQNEEQATINAALITATLLRGTTNAIATGRDVHEYGVPSQRLLSDILFSMAIVGSEGPGWGRSLFKEIVLQAGEHQEQRLADQLVDLARTINRFFPEYAPTESKNHSRNHISGRQEFAAKISPVAENLRITIERIISRHFHTRPLLHQGGNFKYIDHTVYFNFIKDDYINEQLPFKRQPDRTGIPEDISRKFRNDAEMLFDLEKYLMSAPEVASQQE